MRASMLLLLAGACLMGAGFAQGATTGLPISVFLESNPGFIPFINIINQALEPGAAVTPILYLPINYTYSLNFTNESVTEAVDQMSLDYPGALQALLNFVLDAPYMTLEELVSTGEAPTLGNTTATFEVVDGDVVGTFELPYATIKGLVFPVAYPIEEGAVYVMTITDAVRKPAKGRRRLLSCMYSCTYTATDPRACYGQCP